MNQRTIQARPAGLAAALLILAACAGCACAQETDSPELGYYRVRGVPAASASARLQRTPKGDRITIYAGAKVFWQGDRSGASGPFRSQVQGGVAGAFQGHQRATETLLLRATGEGYTGVLRRGHLRRAVLRLHRQPRALIVKTALRLPKERVWMWHYANQVRSSYQRRGYWTEMVNVDSVSSLIARIEAGEPHPFKRVVILGHAGQSDGIVMSPGYGNSSETQVSPNGSHSKHWQRLVTAIKAGTTSDAKIYASGCWTGRNWAPALAKATQRVVAGPEDKTAWRNTTTLAVAALEGEGTAIQQLVIARPDSEPLYVPHGGRLSDAYSPGNSWRPPAHGKGYRGFVREQAERIRGNVVQRRIQQHYAEHIDAVAADSAEADLMRAIVFEELVHMTPGEEALESVGFGKSVGPSQIRADLWASAHGSSRAGLLDPAEHFRVMKSHLDSVRVQARANGLDETPAALGAVWNSMRAKRVNDYGRRVDRYTARFASLRLAGSR